MPRPSQPLPPHPAARTLIPILLTLGLLFSALGTAQWLCDADEPYSAASMRWSAITLPIMGLLLLAIAGLLMGAVARTAPKAGRRLIDE
jgi:ribose/xylose/arabinose/galactoside ABC-type transport system permease subunit